MGKSVIIRIWEIVNNGQSYRCSHIQHGFARYECLFVIILDLDVNDMHWSVKIATSGQ